MEEKLKNCQHRLVLNDRNNGSFTGIVDIISFDTNEILMQTELGRLCVKGKNLHVSRLDLDKKEVETGGEVEALIYSGTQNKKSDSFFSRIFG